MQILRIRGQSVAEVLCLLDTEGWEDPQRLGNVPAEPRHKQVLMAEQFFLRNNATMGLVIVAELVVRDEIVVMVHTLGGKAGVLRTRLGSNNELEQEAIQRLRALANKQDWQLTTVQEYHHGN